MLNLSISLLLLLYYVDGRPHMSWCDYWRKLGIRRAECRLARQPAMAEEKFKFSSYKSSSAVLSMPICDVVTDWSRCQKADHCPLGYLCWVRGNPCCTPQTTNLAIFSGNSVVETSSEPQCPSTSQMGFKCLVRSPINWCYNDKDCHRTSTLQKCCPSGCGYNVCIRTSQAVDMRQRMTALASIVPPQCPSLDLLPFGCKSLGISWCEKDSDCLSNAAQQRHCCPTRCGYNVCLLKTDDNRYIIA